MSPLMRALYATYPSAPSRAMAPSVTTTAVPAPSPPAHQYGTEDGWGAYGFLRRPAVALPMQHVSPAAAAGGAGLQASARMCGGVCGVGWWWWRGRVSLTAAACVRVADAHVGVAAREVALGLAGQRASALYSTEAGGAGAEVQRHASRG